MRLTFSTEAFRNECNNQDQLVKRHGIVRARLIRQRLDELFNAEVLADMLSLPHVAIQAWPDAPGELAVEVGSPYWLVFRPDPQSAGGESGAGRWNKIDSIRVSGLMRADGKRQPQPI